jgi:predicted transcriptional regulator
MASEKSGETVMSVHLPDELREWLDEEADERDSDRETLLRELLAANRAVLTEEGTVEEETVSGASEDALDDRIEEFREEFMDLIEDVRERVIQVKRETDTKAPLEHTHGEFSDLEELVDQMDTVESELSGLEERLETVEADVESGFENYEEIVEYLLDTTEAVDERVDTLASAVVETREQVTQFVSRHHRQLRADELKLAASQYGIQSADCESCDQTLQIALLTAAECPHCASAFSDVSPKEGIFGSATLETGSPPELPAMDGSDLDADIGPDGTVADSDHPAGDVNWQEQGTGGETDD